MASTSETFYRQLSRELVRQWRGERTQLQASIDLGYRSNVFSSWERGRTWPAAHVALGLAGSIGHPVEELGLLVSADWLSRVPMSSQEGVALFLDRLIGRKPMREVAENSGFSRHALSRYLNARAALPLPVFLSLIGLSSRLFTMLPSLCEPEKLASLSAIWERHCARRALHLHDPLAGEIHVALSLDSYRALPCHRPGWLAEQLSLSMAEELSALENLCALGLISFEETHYVCAPENVEYQLEDASPEVVRRQREWMSRRLWVGEANKRQIVTMALTRREARQVRQILEKAAEDIRRIGYSSTGTEEMHIVFTVMNRVDGGDGS